VLRRYVCELNAIGIARRICGARCNADAIEDAVIGAWELQSGK
jgi:hypothetical protein